MPTSVHDLDLPELPNDLRGTDEATALLAAAREQHWLARTPMGYIALRHDGITKVLRDRRMHQLVRLLAEMRDLDPRLRRNDRNSILTAEGDEHQRLRRLVSPAFTPRAADKLRPFMARTMEQLIDPIAAAGTTEAVADLCEPYPIPIICELLGAPAEDWEDFSVWATDVLSGLDADANDKVDRIIAAREALEAYVIELIARRRTEPADDLLTVLIQAEEEGDRLSEQELITMVEAVLVAGVDTTRNQLGCALALFAQHPEQWRLLRDDPSYVPKAVEETMRHLGAVRGTGRYASEDVVIDDILFPRGTVVITSFTTGNHDPDAFADANSFDITKETGGSPQLTFGSGIHHCLGAFLARAELQEALPILARRLPDLALDGSVEWKPPAVAIWGPERLPLSFTPTA